MKLTIFQSDEGDCLLLESRDGKRVLCDGGMGPSMRKLVRKKLNKLPAIDFIYISHIDEDHIGGVLQLLQDEADWRVFDHHKGKTKKPEVPRPPAINGLLYNAFHDILTANQGPLKGLSLEQEQNIEQLLAGLAPSLAATGVPALAAAAAEMQSITTGVPNALRISKLAVDAFKIPLNQPPGVAAGTQLLFADQPGAVFELGSMKFTLIGPTEDELKKLREGWNHWLQTKPSKLQELRAELKRRVDEFSNGNLSGSPFDLSKWEGVPGYEGVTVPNIASLMWMVEEGEGSKRRRLLLTGDGQQDFILNGLKRMGFLGKGENHGVHLDVLKVQHHGSPNNLDVEFARKVSADHYVFCGNGEHTNPDIEVIKLIYNSRLGNDEKVRTLAPESRDRPFHFWFSTTSAAQTLHTKKREYFERIEDEVKKLAKKSKGKLRSHFNKNTSIALEIN
jgi:beta-lactamase superfamily II metal-dependent hydrolase